MPAQPIKIDKDFVDQYWTTGNRKPQKLHKNYNNAVDVSFHIRFHFDGYFMKPWMTGSANSDSTLVNPYFQKLIDSQRPSESDQIRIWRRNMYRPITKVPCNKVVSSLKKIVKSSDWKIDYSGSENPPILDEKNSLQYYCESNFPNDDSIENWAYKTLVKWMLIDPNALICVMPMSWDVEENEFYRPYPYIIQSQDVYDFKIGEYYVFLSPYKNSYVDTNGDKKHGQILIFVTSTQWVEARQVGDDKYEIVEHDHNIGYCPAWIMGGENKTPDPLQPYYESFIQGMLPSLDMAAVDVSDLLAEKIQHVHSTMWYIQGQYCNACQGTGQVLQQGSQVIKQDCPTCGGRGAMPVSPFRNMEINLNNDLAANKNVPFPPAGFIEKDKEMVKLMRDEIETEIHNALAAINMEYLAETPLNESGKAKEVDRDELNNFVYSIAYHLVEEIIKPVYYFIGMIRYQKLIKNEETIEKMLPTIPVPEKYDFLTQKDAADNLIKISGSQVSSGIKDAAEMAYIHQEYAEYPEVRNRLLLVHDHDPLPGFEAGQINNLVMAGLVTKIEAVLSIHISSFATNILSQNDDFMNWDYEKQKEAFYKMAEDKLAELEAGQAAQEPVLDAEGKVIENPTQAQRLEYRKTQLKQRTKDKDPLRNA